MDKVTEAKEKSPAQKEPKVKEAPKTPHLPVGIIDSHAHVMKEYFGEEQEEVIARAFEQNVVEMVNPAVTVDGMEELFDLAKRHPRIHLAAGQHPHEAKDWTPALREKLIKALDHPAVVAVGECGLDYYYNNSVREQQLHCFGEQIDLAVERDLPIVVHCRDAWDDAFELLTTRGKGKLRGVFHCFTGGPEQLPAISKLDFYVSFSGILTYSSAREIQAAAPLVAEDRILVETDCPFLAPQKVRGKRNEPSYVWFTAEKLAALRHVELQDLAPRLSANTRALFKL
ncbi:MAG: TatD family hydrolase [Cyanobacteria bacterium SZAS LIN-2]|nr:TatD family hydrolase [Cyanobacteria bacterium SZAS LIN-3]MBS1995914.1 TatD family hydrolase [Cyanobacteria bacterium SZAS LIN-2]